MTTTHHEDVGTENTTVEDKNEAIIEPKLKVKRRFHDMWAAIAFAIVNISFLICILLLPENANSIISLDFLKTATVSIICTFIAFTITFFSLKLLRRKLIYFSLPLAPVVYLIILIWDGSYHVADIVMLVLLCFVSYISLSIIHANIDTIDKILFCSTSIISEYFYPIIIYGLLSCIWVHFMLSVNREAVKGDFMKNLKSGKVISVFCTAFVFFWNFSLTGYLYDIYVSSIVNLKLTSPGQSKSSITKESVKNTLFGFGSACFGSLLIAILYAAYVVNKYLYKRGENKNDHVLVKIISAILYVITAVILRLMIDLVESLNRFAFIYIGVSGRPLIAAMYESSEIVNETYYPAISFTSTEFIIFVLGVCGGFVIIAPLSYLFDVRSYGFSTCIGILNLIQIFRCVNSANISLLFSSVYAPTLFDVEYPDVSSAVTAYNIKENEKINTDDDQVIRVIEDIE